jgi:hypothetical protein
VDLTVASGQSSPELGLATAPGHDDLPRRHGRLTSDGGAVRWTGDGGERSSAAAIGVERLGA